MNFIIYFTSFFVLFNAFKLKAQITWEQTAEINGGMVHYLAINSLDHIFAATDSGIFISTNNGEEWIKQNVQTVSVFSLLVYSDSLIFAGTDSNGVLGSNDSGMKWSYIGLSGYKIRSLVKNSSGIIFAANASEDTTESGIYRSQDHGVSWKRINQGLTDKKVSILGIAPSNNIFAGTFGIPSGTFKSVNNGNSWYQTYETGVISFSFHPCGYIFAGNAGILLSTDHGENWNYKYPMPVYPHSFGIASNGDIFCGTDYDGYFNYGGMFWSNDTGNSWTEINNGLVGDDRDIYSLTINSNDSIFIGTRNGKIFKSTQSATSPIRNDDKINPSYFDLCQNYPNPFNPATIIAFKIPRQEKVKIEVFNLLGQKIETLINKHMTAGSYDVEFNAKNLPSGIYIYRIIAGKFQDAKKMILFR